MLPTMGAEEEEGDQWINYPDDGDGGIPEEPGPAPPADRERKERQPLWGEEGDPVSFWGLRQGESGSPGFEVYEDV